MFGFFLIFLTATLDQRVLNEMRRCTCIMFFFYSKEIGSKIRQHHTLHIHFIQLFLEINQSLYSLRHKRLHVLLVSCMDMEKGEKTRRTSWESIEVRSLIAA